MYKILDRTEEGETKSSWGGNTSGDQMEKGHSKQKV